MESDPEPSEIGYGRPPRSTRFRKGQSGNPKGRPRNRRRGIPYDHVLGQMVTIREDGRERRVTAAEAFLLQLTKKGLEGCSVSARASLAAIEAARSSNRNAGEDHTVVRLIVRSFGLCCVVEDLGMAVRINKASKDNCRLELKPWIIEAGLARMQPNELSVEQQRVVLASTRSPQKVRWPDWWTVRG